MDERLYDYMSICTTFTSGMISIYRIYTYNIPALLQDEVLEQVFLCAKIQYFNDSIF